jgi:hypothetical protein
VPSTELVVALAAYARAAGAGPETARQIGAHVAGSTQLSRNGLLAAVERLVAEHRRAGDGVL